MLPWIYNLLFPLVFLAGLPAYLWRMVRRGDYRAQFSQRLGWYSPEVRDRLAQGPPRLWVQAVSVGEMLVALKFITALRQQMPGFPLILSATTTTGFRLAQARVDASVEVVYTPLDLRCIVRRTFRVLRPVAVIIVDGGLWPNQLWEARRLGLVTALVNARMSPRSERRFRIFPRLTRQVFELLDLVCVLEETDVARWSTLGTPLENIHFTGSIKYDDQISTLGPGSVRDGRTAESQQQMLLASIGVQLGQRVLLAASTHAGEELLLAQTYLELRSEHPDLFLIIAPRHVERCPAIIQQLSPLGLRITRRTELLPASPVTSGPASTYLEPGVLLLDTTGELNQWYPVATIVFVGKSLTAMGGQNPAEAISAGKAVVVGPHMENFDDLTRSLLAASAILQIENAAGLQPACHQLLANATLRECMAVAAYGQLEKHRGAASRSAATLLARTKLCTC